MVITCASYETRFQVADGRIPEKGAWVRCSRCHHRFLVTPSVDGTSAEPEEQDSAPPEMDEQGATTETDLDNPQFLFDREEESSEGGDADDAAAMEIEGSETPMPGQDYGQTGWQDHPDEPEESPAPAEPSPSEAIAPSPSEAIAPSPSEAIADSDGPDEQSFAGIGAGDDEFGEEPGGDLGGAGPSLPELDDDGDGLESWDTLASGKVSGLSPVGSADAPVSATTDISSIVLKSSRGTPAHGEVTPRGPDLESFTLRVLAIVVAIALSAGGVRAVALHGMGEVGGPAAVDANGWQATEFQVHRLHDAAGQPVIVIRGKLYKSGREPAPDVQATLLDRSGRGLSDPTSAVLVRLKDSELTPDSLSDQLVDYAEWTRARPPSSVHGFTVLVATPSEDARRFRLELLPRPPTHY